MIFVKFFAASFLFIFILTSCSDEPEPIPNIPTLKATIKGKVRDADTGEPIYYATIFTIPPSTETQTGIDGEFILADIWPKDYMVYGYIQGFDDDSDFVSLHDGDTANANLHLNNFREYLDYYPLDLQNYWIYKNNGYYFSIEIVSDIIFSNKTYRVIQERTFPSGTLFNTRYERLDTINSLVYRYYEELNKEFIIDSLAAKLHQWFTSNMFVYPDPTTHGYNICKSYCFDVQSDSLFGVLSEVKYLKHYCATDQPEYHLAKGLGIIRVYRFYVGSDFLIYARIKGVEYGEKP